MAFEGIVQDLIDELGRLPGIGPKGATRIAFHILQAPDEAKVLSRVLGKVADNVRYCRTCLSVAQEEQCRVCRDPRRSHATICVVARVIDVEAIERTRGYQGVYHVLGGLISPFDDVGPDDLSTRELYARITPDVREVILATDPNLEGEATANYLARYIAEQIEHKVRITRLASGLPVGGDLEYADELTLGRAFEGRRILAAGTP